ncbi:hypothetical protein BDW66DRAFT_167443 [Aspergillus desertorum]
MTTLSPARRGGRLRCACDRCQQKKSTQLAEAKARTRELEALVTAQNSQRKPAVSENSLSSGFLRDPRDFDTALAMFQREVSLCGVGSFGSAKRESFRSAVSDKMAVSSISTSFYKGCLKRLALGTIETQERRQRTIAFITQLTEMHQLEPAFLDADPDAYMVASPQQAKYLRPLGQMKTVDSTAGGGCTIYVLYSGISMVHRTLAIRFDRPPLLNDIDLDLRLPDGYATSFLNDHFSEKKTLSSPADIYPSDIRMSLIKSKIYTLLYSDHGRAEPGAIRLQCLRELDEELSALTSSFPDSYYTFHDLSKIHEASSAYSFSPTGVVLLPFSVELFYQVSRIIILYLSYILTAVVSLSRYLITFPIAQTFNSGLQLLITTSDFFSDFDRESQTTRRFAPCFTRELIFLAKQSAKQAMSGQECS